MQRRANLLATIATAIARAPSPDIRILTAEGQETTAVQAGEDIVIEVAAKFNRPVSQPMIGMLIRNRLGIEVFGTNTKIEGIELGDFAPGDSVDRSLRLPLLSHSTGIHTHCRQPTFDGRQPGLAG